MMGRGLKIPGIATKKPTKPIVIKLTSFLLYSPSEYFLCDAIHSSQCFSRSGKQFLQSSFVNLSRASWGFVLFLLFFFLWISSTVTNLFPFSFIFNFGIKGV